MRTDVFWSLTNSPQFAGVSAVQIPDVRSLPPVEGAIGAILAPGLWALQTRSWRRPKLPSGSNRQPEHRVLARPLGRSIAQTSDPDAARQPSLDGCLHEFGRQERKRDRHIDLSNAAFVPRSDLLDTGDGAADDLIKPTSATRDRCNERRAGLGANGSKIVWRHRYRCDDLVPSLHRGLFPWDAQNKSIIVHRIARVAGFCLELNRQLLCLQLDSDDVVADEVSAITFCAIPELLADGACDARLDFGRRHPANRSGPRGLPMEEGG